MNQLGCYKNLHPDSNSAPAHIIRSLRKSNENSKRQSALKLREMNKFQSRLAAKKRLKSKHNKNNINEEKLDNETSQSNNNLENEKEKKTKKQTLKLKEKKLNTILDANFSKDLWNCELNNFFF
jgi:hypothetical protein